MHPSVTQEVVSRRHMEPVQHSEPVLGTRHNTKLPTEVAKGQGLEDMPSQDTVLTSLAALQRAHA